MNKLLLMEKKFKKEKYFREDPNRQEVIQASSEFLQEVSKKVVNVPSKKSTSSSEDVWELKEKPRKIFIID